MKKVTLLITLLFTSMLMAQVTTVPASIIDVYNGPVIIIFDPDQGNLGMVGASKCYAHTGLITSASTDYGDWKYVVEDWRQNTSKTQLTRDGSKWKLKIDNIYNFYGCSPSTEIKALAFVFHDGADGSKEGKTDSNQNIIVKLTNPIKVADYPLLSFEISSESTVSLINCKRDAAGECSIPSTIKHQNKQYSVTSIGGGAFYNCSAITSITIPESVTSIGNYAFSDCSSLTSVTIGESVTSIGNDVFSGCSALESVVWNAKNYLDFFRGDIASFYAIRSQIKSFTFGDAVEHIPAYLCYGMEKLTSVTIGDGVTSIGDFAFSNCSGLTKTNYTGDIAGWCTIEFGHSSSNPIYYSRNLFIYDQEIKDLVIPDSVTSIGDCTFYNCSGLTSVTIGNSVTSIGNYAFGYCSSLTSVTIGDGVTSIGNSAFYNCSSLASVTIGDGVTSIGNSAFSNCSSLTKTNYTGDIAGWCAIEFGGYTSNPIYYSKNLFIYDQEIKDLVIPDSVTSIGDCTFSNCSGLTSVTIGNSVTSIGDYAFYNCSSLTSVTIPDSVTSIGNSAFGYCSSLASVTIGDGVTSIGNEAFDNCSSLTSVTIGESVTSIGNSAFSNCSSLASVTIGDGVTSIGNSTFSNCSSLTSVTIGDGVTSIGNYAFYNCSTLASVTIGDGVTSIGYWTFSYCSSLTSITIGKSVTSIGNYAFDYCSALESVVWNAKNYPDFAEDKKVSFYAIRSQIKSFTFGDAVEHIPAYLCYGMEKLTSVTIGDGVTSIGDFAFSNCSGLTSVTVGNGVTSIGDYAFSNCSGLTSVTIGKSVTSIGNYAFGYCSGLTSVTIGKSVTSIGNYAFCYCSALESVVWNAKNYPDFGEVEKTSFYAFRSQIKSFIFGDAVEHIPACLCYGMEKLTSVTIGESVTSIGNSAFSNCSGLTKTNYTGDIAGWCTIEFGHSSSNPIYYSKNLFIYDQEIKDLVIPDSVTSIGDCAFYNCSGLTSVTIGNSVTSIGDYAFGYCSSLTSVTCKAEAPPTVGYSAFGGGVSTSIPIYVPCGCVSAYKTASGWRDFSNIQEPLTEYSIEVDVNDTIMGTAKVDYNTFCLGNQISATPNTGYHFVQWNDGNTNNPRTLLLTQDTTLTAEFSQSFSGQCGEDLFWAYDQDSKTISITGNGDMYDYTEENQPWVLFKEEIKMVSISNTSTSIGTSAFEGCVRLAEASIGTSMEDIAANAFAGCTRLYHIYCYATYPPFANESSFANYNVYLHIPCENQEDYTLDMVWGQFKHIECIGADNVENTDDVVINAGATDVTITWPSEENANTYTIVIEKDGEVFCTLTFDADGRLLNMAFTPGRDGHHIAQYAEALTHGGFRFTVTGLNEKTRYGYDIRAKDTNDNIIQSHSGEFTTKENASDPETPTTVVDVESDETANTQKMIRDGQLVIIRDGKTYNTMGQEL